MFSKVNVINIVRDHCRTIQDFSTRRVSAGDLLLFVGFPILVAALLLKFDLLLSKDSVQTLLAAFSILTGLLFNLLVLILDVLGKAEPSDDDEPAERENKLIKARLLKETYANISYSVLLGIFLSALSLGGLCSNSASLMVFSALVYGGSTNFVLTLLMILKRIHALLGHEFRYPDRHNH